MEEFLGEDMNDFIRKIENVLNIMTILEVSDTTKLRSMFDDGGVPVETGILLYALIKLQKPENVLELGLYSAISTIFMAEAIKENGLGHIDSFEIEQRHIERSKDRLNKLGLNEFVTIYNQSSLDYQPQKQYDFILSDTEPALRFLETVKYYPFLKEGGYLVIHDLHGHLGQVDLKNMDHPDFKFWPWGELPQQIKDWLKTDKLRTIPFPDTRGFSLFYKPRKDDYVAK